MNKDAEVVVEAEGLAYGYYCQPHKELHAWSG